MGQRQQLGSIEAILVGRAGKVKIKEESLFHYLSMMERKMPFSMAGFSDAEWYCILGEKEGQKTGLGQVISAAHGVRLLNVLKQRQHRQGDEFIFAVPKCINMLPG